MLKMYINTNRLTGLLKGHARGWAWASAPKDDNIRGAISTNAGRLEIFANDRDRTFEIYFRANTNYSPSFRNKDLIARIRTLDTPKSDDNPYRGVVLTPHVEFYKSDGSLLGAVYPEPGER